VKYKIVSDIAIPPRVHRVTPSELLLTLQQLKPNQSVHNISKAEYDRFRNYASRYGIKIIGRLINRDKKLYSIWRAN